MCAIAGGDDVALAGARLERAAVAQLRHELALEDVDDMASLAPVIRDIAGRILDHARADVADLERPPRRLSRRTGVEGLRDRGPVDRLKRNLLELHVASMTRTAKPLRARGAETNHPHVSDEDLARPRGISLAVRQAIAARRAAYQHKSGRLPPCMQNS